jgi:LmbE family N-acetylglucosaminyl deacetylase
VLITLALVSAAALGQPSKVTVGYVPGNVIRIVADSAAHVIYGLSYPVTYKISIPSGSTQLSASRRYSTTDAWYTITEKSSQDFFNGEEVVRFDYAASRAYVSVPFGSTTDTVYLKITNTSGQNVAVEYLEVCTYYDNRKAAVTISADDWEPSVDQYFRYACGIFRSYRLWVSVGIITKYPSADSNWDTIGWNSIQQELDSGYVEAASHSRTHTHVPYADPVSEVAGSKEDIPANLSLPAVFKNGSQQYVYAWIDPYGEYDGTIENLVAVNHYLVPRNTIKGISSFSNWDDTGGKFTQVGATREMGPFWGGSTSLVDLNGAFDAAVASGGIYHLMCHPWLLSEQGEWDKPYTLQHLSYISNRKDIWYVPFGLLYLYHWTAINVSVINAMIMATANGQGTITPSGAVLVNRGTDTTFMIRANVGTHIDSVVVDGSRVDSATSYTFTNVQTNHSIAAYFPPVTMEPLLIVAPHPDDETLIGAGSIRSAVLQGRPAYVVVATNGDYFSGPSFGIACQGQTVSAVALLGLSEDKVYFLSYPDGWLLALRNNYPSSDRSYTTSFGVSATYGTRGYGGKDVHSAFYGMPASYNWPNFVSDFATVISAILPSQIIVTGPEDGHPDHRATYHALWEAISAVASTHLGWHVTVGQTIVHATTVNPFNDTWDINEFHNPYAETDSLTMALYAQWPEPTSAQVSDRFDPSSQFSEPPGYHSSEYPWSNRVSVPVPSEMRDTARSQNLKYQTIAQYANQNPAAFLNAFCKQDEFWWLETLGVPRILSQPLNKNVSVGDTAMFRVVAVGQPPLLYQWQKDEVDIPGATDSLYTTPTTVLTDSGLTFRCIVTNAYGSDTSDQAMLAVTVPRGIISDDFNAGALNAAVWTFINLRGDATLTMTGTQVSISIPAGTNHDVWTDGNNAPRIMQAANNTDFEVTLKFDSPMTVEYQMLGLIAKQDTSNFLRFDFVRDGSATRIYAASFTGGSVTVKKDSVITGGNPLYLRVKRVGNQWTESFSYNGTTWMTAVSFSYTLVISSVGPFVGNYGNPESSAPAFTGLIDYFRTAAITANLKAFLQGPFTTPGDSMRTSLRQQGYLPLQQPYNVAPWSYSGTESVVSIPSKVVDWVLVELRTGTSAASKIGTRAAFIKGNGSIVDLDGVSPVAFANLAAGNYYVVVRHRNHLAVMSASAVALSASSGLYDFSTGLLRYYGGDAKDLGGGKFGLYAGDGNGDGGVYAEDYTLYRTHQANEGYDAADYNMDSGVYAEDYTLRRINQGKETQVP